MTLYDSYIFFSIFLYHAVHRFGINKQLFKICQPPSFSHGC